MLSRLIYSGVLLCCTIGCFINKAIAQHFYLQKYTVNDGLADSYILRICQDSQGFLWLGTVNGLSRFDGKEFINYGYAEGLPNLCVDAVYEDHHKRLWAGTRKGIVEVKGRKCIAYPMNDGEMISFVFGIKESEHNELWAFTDKGLYRFEQQQWKKIKLYPGLENHHCRSIIETDKGRLINYGNYMVVQDNNGAYKITGKYPLDEPYYNTVREFHKQLYLSLPNKLLLLRPEDTLSLFQQALYKKSLGTFFCDSKDRFWISTDKDGLLVSKKGSTQIITDTIPVAYNLVSDTYEDRDGNIWVACADGLLKIREVSYTLFTATRYPLVGRIWYLAKIADTTLMACTQGGLLQYKNGTFSHLSLTYSSTSTRTGIFSEATDGWCQDAQGRTWLVMREKKLYLLDHNIIKDLSHLAIPRPGNYWRVAYNNSNNKVYLCNDTLLYGDEYGLHAFKSADNQQYIIKSRAIHAFHNGKVLVHASGNKFLLVDTGNHVQDVSAAIGIRESNPELSFYS